MSEIQAIFLCAGAGTRVRDVAGSMPKSLLPVSGQPLLEIALDRLQRVGVTDVHVIGGYEWKQIQEAVGDRVRLRVWDGWETSNNLWTLAANADLLTGTGDRLILFGDVIFDDNLLPSLLASDADIALAVDTTSRLEGTMRVAMHERGLAIGNHVAPEDADGNFIGVLKLSGKACEGVRAELISRLEEGANRTDYYTAVLPEIASDLTVEFVPVDPGSWAEVDTEADYESAKRRFEKQPEGADL